VDLLHVNKLEWAEIRNRIKQTYVKWHLSSIIAEKNSIGGVNIEALRGMGVNISPFETTNESKAAIMSNMNEALHNGGWKLLDIPEQKHELNTFVATQLPSGAWRLAAQADGHDDIVIGDALGIWAASAPVAAELVDFA
jgi:Leu/Phe-tRNA-protein transferase